LIRHTVFLVCLSLVVLSCSASRLSVKEAGEISVLKEKEISERALGFFIENDFMKAIDTYALILNRENAERRYAAWARYETGFCYYYMQDFENACLHFEKVQTDFPEEEFLAQRLLAKKLIEKIAAGRTEGT
jgi:tetratricopeptide (TPR) repeat protein